MPALAAQAAEPRPASPWEDGGPGGGQAQGNGLPGPFAEPPSPGGLRPLPATMELVRSQVGALLAASGGFHALPPAEQERLRRHLVKIAAYAAELARDVWHQADKLGQRPVVKTSTQLEAPLVRAQSDGDNFQASAAGRVARITQQTLRAVAFPTFVSDLIKGTFEAITNATIEQLQAYTELLSNVSKTVDQFMADNISDNQARDWLAQRYPEYLEVTTSGGAPRLRLRPGADDRPAPSWRRDLNLSQDVGLDLEEIEQTLVPAARRKLAEGRLQVLSTMVLMGVSRLVVTAGKIRATMGFHIDTTDRLHTEHATDFDFRSGLSASYGFGPWRASAAMSLAYVRSTRAQSDHELNLDTDLTGEVELHFKSDYLPLQAFADSAALSRIRGNTPVPGQADLFGQIATGGSVGRYQSPRSRRSQRQEPALRRLGVLPDAPQVPQASSPSAGSGSGGRSGGGSAGRGSGASGSGGGGSSSGGGSSGGSGSGSGGRPASSAGDAGRGGRS